MEDKIFKKHIKNAPFGYAYHKIILDKNDKPVDFIFIDINPAYEKLMGVKESKVINKKASEVLPELINKIGDFIKHIGEVALSGQEKEFEFYSENLGRWYSISAYSTEKYYFNTIFTDINKQKAVEKDLQQERILLKTVINNIPDTIYAKDSNKRKILVNKADLENMGCAREEEALGKTDFDFYPYETAKTFDDLDSEVIKNRKPLLNIEHKLIMPSGKERWLNSWKVPLFNNKKEIVGLVGIGYDITKHKQMIKELEDEKHYFQTLIDALPDNVYFKNHNHQFLRVNEAKAKDLNTTPEKMIGKTDSDYYPSDIAETCIADENNVYTTGKSIINKEEEKVSRDGREWILTSKFPLHDRNGLIIGTMGISRNINEQKKIEKKLHQERILLKTVINNLPDCIYAKDLERRKILVNKADLENLGFTHEDEAIGRTDFDTYPYEIAKEFDKVDLEVMKNGKPIIDLEDRLILPSGKERWLNTSKLPLYNEKKEIVGLVGIGHDITERIKAEQALRESEKKFRTLFTQMNEMVVIHEIIYDDSGKSTDYRIIDCNPAFSETTGIKRKEAIGKLASEIYKSSPPPFLEEYTKVALTGSSHYFTTYYPPMDKHFKISAVSPKKGQFATITADVTAIQQFNEMLIEKNKELENYLYVASHDLRSPLVNIQGFTARLKKHTDNINEILSETSFDEETKLKIKEIVSQKIPSSLEYIFTNVTKMDSLIKSLLQISRTGRVNMTIQKVNMNELIDEITQSLDFQIKETKAKFFIDNLYDCYGDKELLNQLFTNIVSNALKYRNKKKNLILKISSKIWYNKVLYRISDNGIGISENDLSKIWNVFYRVESSDDIKGEGIGLSIAKRIVDKHKGKIWAESEINEGSTFNIELPNKNFTEQQ